jgi:hypothetical protein
VRRIDERLHTGQIPGIIISGGWHMRRFSVFHKRELLGALSRRGAQAALALTIVLAAASTSGAQTTTGMVRGYLRGEGGTAVASGQVTARNAEMGIIRNATASTEGFYSIAGLRPGTYTLEARRIGFQPQTRTITVQIGQTLDQNFDLTASATQLAGVQVIATARQEAKTSEVATNVTQAQINDLPSPSRNILDLALLAPSVRVTPDRLDATGKSFAAGAQAAEQINVFIDGASYKNDIINGGVAGQDASRGNPFPRNAVQEFRVSTSNLKAEYQKASSAIITAITKSGTNEWQGGMFTEYQNKDLVALDTFARAQRTGCLAQIPQNPKSLNGTPCFQKPDYSRYLVGFSGGGPLVRDKLFIFGSYEGNLQNRQGITRLNGTPSTWPTAIAGVNGNAHDAPFRSHLLFGKLSYNLSDKQLIELSGDGRLESDQRDFGGQFSCSCWDFSTGDFFHSNVVTGRAKHSYFGVFGTNEALVSYQWYQWHNEPFDFTTPAQDYAGIGRIGGHDAVQNLTQRRLSIRDDYTLTARRWSGAHVPKFGFNADFLDYNLDKQLNDNPTFFFDATNNYQSPVRATIGFGNPTIANNNSQIGFYAQDDWSTNDRLTLNLGVRWDYESGMFNRNYVTPQPVRDSITAWSSQSFVPIDPSRYFTNGTQRKPFYGAIQPRVGLSYSLDDAARTTAFAGYGVYYDRITYNSTIDEQYRRQHPNYNFNFGTGPGQIPWNQSYFSRQGLLNVINSGQAPPQEVFLIPNDLKPPHSNQWTVGLRHAFESWNGSISYNNIRSFNGFTFEWGDVSFQPNQNRNCCLERRVGGNANRTYGNVLVGNNSVRTWYDGVQIQLDRPYRRTAINNWGWGGGVTWTISKSEAEGGDLFSFPQLSFNSRHPIADDERHRVVLNWITDIPIKYIRGIQFSGLATLASGRPFNRSFSTPQGFVTEFGVARVPPESFIIPQAFAYRTLDLRLRKDFVDVGGNRVGVTLDGFNFFNTRNLGCYSDFAGSFDNTGKFSPDAGYGKPGCTIADPRRVQIGISYDFGARINGR